MVEVNRLPSRVVASAAVLALLFGGCASSRTAAVDSWSPRARAIEPLLRAEVSRWDGTPHADGGTTASGMDCSAFVQRVYADAFDVVLPRMTTEQAKVGRRVSTNRLQAGDLVFFRPSRKTRHVGIYLSDGEFAHVSSSEGVTVSELDLPYWQRAYSTARRVLADSEPGGPQHLRPEADAARDGGVEVSVPARSGRRGW